MVYVCVYIYIYIYCTCIRQGAHDIIYCRVIYIYIYIHIGRMVALIIVHHYGILDILPEIPETISLR